jgi:hypothetical protein
MALEMPVFKKKFLVPLAARARFMFSSAFNRNIPPEIERPTLLISSLCHPPPGGFSALSLVIPLMAFV